MCTLSKTHTRTPHTHSFIWDWVDQGVLLATRPGQAEARPPPPATLEEAAREAALLLSRAYTRDRHWGYGGDFNDYCTDFQFCINGLMWPDRSPHPGALEAKYLQQVACCVRAHDLRRTHARTHATHTQPLRVELQAPPSSKLRVVNKFSFLGLLPDTHAFEWQAVGFEGEVLQAGS